LASIPDGSRSESLCRSRLSKRPPRSDMDSQPRPRDALPTRKATPSSPPAALIVVGLGTNKRARPAKASMPSVGDLGDDL
jgi:hypothetical protein